MPAAIPLADLFTAEDWVTLLDVSLTGIHLVRPVYTPDGCTIVDFALEYLNPAAQRMAGLSEQPGSTLLGCFPHTLAAGVFAYYQRVFATGELLSYETNYQADGLDNYFRLSARRSGAHLVVSFTDTSDQNRSAAEEALRESQAAEQAARAEVEAQRQRFHEVLMQLPAHVAVYYGPDHIYQFVNPPYQRMFPHRTFAGRPFCEATPESEGLGVVALFDQVYQTGEPFYAQEMEGWFDFQGTGQPEQLFFNLFLHPLRDAQGRIDGILDFSYDVTEQVRARRQVEQLNQELEARVQQRTQQLAAQQGELQRVFEQAPVAIAVFRGPAYTIELANDLQLAIWDKTREQALGKGLFELLPEVAGQGFEQIITGVMATGQSYVGVDAPASFTRHGVREGIFVSFVHHPLREADGRISGVVAVIHNTTEQVLARQQVQALNEELSAMNEELQQSNTQLTRTNVDLDTFVYTASHDLKAPITNIESIVLALRDTLPPEVQQEEVVAHLLDLLDQTVARFQLTINQLTDISRLQLAHAGPAEPVNLAAVLEAVRLDLAPALVAADTQLTVVVAPNLVVSFSPANLRSIVYNLLSNAVKYRAPNRPAQVRVHAAQTGPGVVLTVQDNGLGMSELQQRQLFGLFQRLHTHVEGTGVGLYITKRLVENAGGTIAVQSQPGVGSTFSVTFPA